MFNNYKEIVTKAIVGKGKKTIKNSYEITLDKNVDTVLGCWVINHDLKGFIEGDYIKITGSYDINIWYSYDNNTKTDVVSRKEFYDDRVHVRLRDKNVDLSDEGVIVRSLKNPSCIDVNNNSNVIQYTISKELGIEIVGDQKIRIPISNSEEEYDILIDEEEINKQIDNEVKEDYIKEKV